MKTGGDILAVLEYMEKEKSIEELEYAVQNNIRIWRNCQQKYLSFIKEYIMEIATVISAMGAGKVAAKGIDEYISSKH